MAAPVFPDTGRAAASVAGPSASTSRQSIATPGSQAAENPVSQKQMTKAQRRELQEKQREKKAQDAAAKAQGGEKGGVKGKVAEKASGAAGAQGRGRRGTMSGGDPPPLSGGRGGRDTRESTHGDEAAATRGLRIFSHFGQPKPPSNIKGDIHPAIIRLGLQFSTFKITGANARCIATLNTFKTVR